jgi:hypothetical protein
VNLSNEFLALCKKLHDSGLEHGCKPGAIVTRGFADLGHEPFLVLPGQKCLSLLSGQKSDIPETQLEALALVPNCDEAVAILAEKGYQVDSLFYDDQREWMLTVSQPVEEGSSLVETAPSLQEVFIQVLIAVNEKSPS